MINTKIFNPTAASTVEATATASKGHSRQHLDRSLQVFLPVLCNQQQVIVGMVLGKLDFVSAVPIQFQSHPDMPVHFVLKEHEKETAQAKVLDWTCMKTKRKKET
jgi:hypothetical protein